MTEPDPLFLLLRVEATPYDDDPASADDLYHALGVYLVAWGRFEGHFVSHLRTMSVLAWDIESEHELPIAWTRRLRLWKHFLKVLPQLAPIRDAARKLAGEMLVASRDRSTLFHGLWGDFVAADPPAIELVSVRSIGDETEVGNMALSLPRVERMISVANTLNSRLKPIGEFLHVLRPIPTGARTLLRPIQRQTMTPHTRPRAPKRG